MDKHYACSGGCGGMSAQMKACETGFCPKNGEMMKECSCTDGSHSEIVESSPEVA